MKKYFKNLVAVMISCMMFFGISGIVSAAAYPDVNPGDWYYGYVQDVSDKGLMSGYSDTGKFGPNDKLTRGQFATILWRMAGSPEVEYNGQFPDVGSGQFYTTPAAWASANGIITGYSSNGCFGPNDNINREQMATILYRYDGSPSVDAASFAGFPDAGSVNEFAKNGIAYAVSNKILTGDNGCLVPQGHVVRAVCATMISRFDNGGSGNNNSGNNNNGGDTNNGQNPDGEYGSPEDPDEAPQIPDIQPWADRNGFERISNAEYQKTIDGVCYKCSHGGNPNDPEGTESRWHIWVTDGKAASGSIVIPESFDGIVVDGIGYGAFTSNKTITDITIPATVTRIVETAFNNVEIKTYIFKGDVPYGFNGINPWRTAKVFTIRYPKNASGWADFKLVSDYFEPIMEAY